MGRFIKGQVVVLPFPFSDLTAAKKRPALVVAQLPGDDLILCQITSVKKDSPYAVSLLNVDFSSGGLSKPSYVNTNRIFTGDSNLILNSCGQVSERKLQEVIARIIKTFTE